MKFFFFKSFRDDRDSSIHTLPVWCSWASCTRTFLSRETTSMNWVHRMTFSAHSCVISVVAVCRRSSSFSKFYNTVKILNHTLVLLLLNLIFNFVERKSLIWVGCDPLLLLTHELWYSLFFFFIHNYNIVWNTNLYYIFMLYWIYFPIHVFIFLIPIKSKINSVMTQMPTTTQAFREVLVWGNNTGNNTVNQSGQLHTWK